MADSGKKWLLGCGLGCAGLIVLLVLVIGGGALFFKDSIDGWREASKAQAAMAQAQRELGDFTPAWDGALATGSIESFLAVQASTAGAATELVAGFEQLHDRLTGTSGKLGRVWTTMREGAQIGPRLAHYVRDRTTALLEQGMSPSEYLYLHSLIYHCWLGLDPAAGADQVAAMLDEDGVSFRMTVGEGSGRQFESRELAAQLLHNLHEQHRQWLRAMLREAPSVVGTSQRQWLDTVQAELARFERGTAAVPWTESFPPSWEAVLASYRSSLLTGWNEHDNLLTLMLLD
jgi:hypothetical protein